MSSSKSPGFYLGLIHGPVLNKEGKEITTSVTNMDIHDISRSCRTFGISKYFIVTPIQAQHELLKKILGFWEEDTGNIYNPDRQDALSLVQLAFSLEESIQAITEKEGVRPLIVVTGANFEDFEEDAEKIKKRMMLDNVPMYLLFGTGWGLPASTTDHADYRLRPIFGNNEDGYNHLSVRSAVAIYCDRLRGGL